MALVTNSIALVLASLAVYAQDQGTIEGRVTNSVTGEGISQVKVRFLDRQSYVYETLTDASGAYRISGLKDNDYKAEFSRDGFAEGGSPFFHVAAASPARRDAILAPYGSLRGRVLDENGNPASRVPVEIGWRDGHAMTDAKGEFEYDSLPAGSYTLAAKPDPIIRVQDGERLGTVTVFYPSATEPAQAVPILVRSGENVSGIEVRLRSVPVRRLSGIVLDEAGRPSAHATIALLGHSSSARQTLMFSPSMRQDGDVTYTIGPVNPPEIEEALSRDDGTFEFPAVEAGEWRLSATLGADSDAPLAGVASVVISSKDVEDVQIRLSGPFAVGVVADWGDGAPPKYAARASNLVELLPVDSQPRMNLDPEKNVTEIHGLFPGRYRILPFSLPPQYYGAAVMWGGRNVAGEAVDLVPGAEPFRVVYKSGFGSVRGTVEKGEGATIVAYPREAGDTALAHTAECGPDGSYALANLAPGDYYIAAFPHRSGNTIPWNALPAALVPIAATVHVEPNSTVMLNVQVNQWPW